MNALPRAPRAPQLLLRIAAFAGFAMAAWSSHAATAEALLERVSPSIWMVKAMDGQGRALAYGSAVVVGAGRLVTNCHVLRTATALAVRREQVERPARLAYADPQRDLCLLDAAGLAAPAVTLAPAGSARPGQKVVAVGVPGERTPTLSAGSIDALIRGDDGGVNYLQISVVIFEGSSGGGLFTEDGQLVGITTAALRSTTQTINFARPAEWIDEVPRRGAAALAEYRRAAADPSANRPALPPTSP